MFLINLIILISVFMVRISISQMLDSEALVEIEKRIQGTNRTVSNFIEEAVLEKLEKKK